MRAFEPNPPVTQAAHTMVQTMFFRGYFENELCSGAWFELGRTDSTKCVVSQTFYFQRPVSPHNTKKKKKPSSTGMKLKTGRSEQRIMIVSRSLVIGISYRLT